MFVIICAQHEVEAWLKILSCLFEGTNTLLILEDCAASKDVKRCTGQLVNLAFSARHFGISVWVLSQKLTGITASFRENATAIVLFYTPSAKTTKASSMTTPASSRRTSTKGFATPSGLNCFEGLRPSPRGCGCPRN